MYNEDCPHYTCKDCKHYHWVVRGKEEACCRRVDHKHIEFAVPWFRSAPEERGFPCKEFEPSDIHVWDLKNYWTNWENWWQDWIDTYCKGVYPTGNLNFIINGDRSVHYQVPVKEYIEGTMLQGTHLNACKRQYYKQDHNSGMGYRLITEELPNGVDLDAPDMAETKEIVKTITASDFPAFPKYTNAMYEMNEPCSVGHELLSGGWSSQWHGKYGGGETYGNDEVIHATFRVDGRRSIFICGTTLQISDISATGHADYNNDGKFKLHKNDLETDKIEKILDSKFDCKFWDIVQKRARELYEADKQVKK